jgi:hypothetical protein
MDRRPQRSKNLIVVRHIGRGKEGIICLFFLKIAKSALTTRYFAGTSFVSWLECGHCQPEDPDSTTETV